jgi:hypothetical protein
VTLFYSDISAFQHGLRLDGALAVAAKATEGTGWESPEYPAQKAEAARVGAFLVAYHFLHAGNVAAQAAWAHQHAGPTPLMVDFEPGLPGSPLPSLADCCGFIDAYRALGGVVHLVYLPRWYWASGLGSPPLAPLTGRSMILISSSYTRYTDAASGLGWQPYGGMFPAVWQFTDALIFNGQPVDFNAYRGSVYAGKQDPASVAATIAEFRSLAATGRLPAPPKPPPPPTPVPTEEDDQMILDQLVPGVAVCLPVPAGKTHLVLCADEMGGVTPELRIGFQPWTSASKVAVSWASSPVRVTLPVGTRAVTVSRQDAGHVLVSAGWA